jgi:hypothetical protein
MWPDWSEQSTHKVASFARACVFVGFGVSVMVLAELIPNVTTRHVIAELVVAIIVATVAVYAIALRAHDRLIDRIVSQLTAKAEALHTAQAEITRTEIDKIVKIGQEHFNRLEAVVGRSSRAALPDVLQAVFKNHDPKLHTHTIAMIEALEEMEATQSWTDHVAMRFVGDLLRYVSINATNLAGASKTPGGAYDITLPRSSNQLADSILAGQMDQLVEGDSYVVVSDLSSWNNGLSEFFLATRRALKKSVMVRRLVCPFDEDRLLAQADIDEFLKQHWDATMFAAWRDSSGLPMYELGILTRREVLSNHNLRIEHVGVFHHAGQIACFEPRKSDLSLMTFSKADKLDQKTLAKLWERAHTNYRIDQETVTLVSRQEIENTLGADWWKADQEIRRPWA